MPNLISLCLKPTRLAQIAALSISLYLTAQAQTAATATPAAPAVSAVTQAPVAKASLTLKRVPTAEHRLIGTWRSIEDAAKKTPPGNLFFQPNGTVLIAPDNYKPLTGTWSANTTSILLNTTGNGEALVHYVLAKDHNLLTMHFDNGLEQVFFRLPTKQGKKP